MMCNNSNNFVNIEFHFAQIWYSTVLLLEYLFNHGFISLSDRGRSRGDTPPDHKMSDQSDDEFDTGQGQAVSRFMSTPSFQNEFMHGMGFSCLPGSGRGSARGVSA